MIKKSLARLLVVLGLSAGAGDSGAATEAPNEAGGHLFRVSDYGARGDGVSLDTASLNQAIEACAQVGGGQVRLGPGRYLSGTIQLRSHVSVYLEAGATIVGTTNLAAYRQPSIPSDLPETKWGKWHRALVLGEKVEDIAIGGPGMIDGNRVFDPTGEERQRGPHAVLLVECRGFNLRDLTIRDAANYAVLFQVSDQVDIRNVRFIGGWDGVHFRGAPGRDCHDVTIVGCSFETGDDAIAGRYWDRVVIAGCLVNSSCNGIRLIGPASHLIVHDCLFYGPGRQPHRTSNRTNMLSGIILQPGAWDATQGALDDVLISDVTMHNVASPVDVWLRAGNTAGRITVERLNATGVYRAACSVESWAETPITNVIFRDVQVAFAGRGRLEQAHTVVGAPGVDSRTLPAWGLYARRVEHLTIEDTRFDCDADDFRPVIQADGVEQLTLDHFQFTRVDGVGQALALTNVGRLTLNETRLLEHDHP